MTWNGSGPFLFDGAAAELGFLPIEAVTTGLEGVLSVTLADATLSATGTVAIQGAASITLADAIASGAAGLFVTATLTATLADATLQASGVLPIAGAAAVTLADAALSSDAALALTGALAVTLEPVTATAEGGTAGGRVKFGNRDITAIYFRGQRINAAALRGIAIAA